MQIRKIIAFYRQRNLLFKRISIIYHALSLLLTHLQYVFKTFTHLNDDNSSKFVWYSVEIVEFCIVLHEKSEKFSQMFCWQVYKQIGTYTSYQTSFAHHLTLQFCQNLAIRTLLTQYEIGTIS